MTVISVAKRIGISVAALQIASRQIMGRDTDRDPVISVAIEGEDWMVINHRPYIAFDVQIESITYAGIMATFPLISILSNVVRIRPVITVAKEAFKISRGQLSPRSSDVREILRRKWNDLNRGADETPAEQIEPITARYRNADRWRFRVTADLVLRIVGGYLSIRNIQNDYIGDREA